MYHLEGNKSLIRVSSNVFLRRSFSKNSETYRPRLNLLLLRKLCYGKKKKKKEKEKKKYRLLGLLG